MIKRVDRYRGMSVFAAATFGITWHKMGFDLDIIPAGILTGSFRIDLDFLILSNC